MQSVKDDWRQTLPPDWTVDWRGEDGVERSIPLREHPALAKYASKDEAVKALAHAQRILGRKEAAPAGRPEKPEDYAFPDIALDEGFEPDQDVLDGFRAAAYDLGLTAGQAAGLYAWFLPLNMRAARDLRDRSAALREDELGRLRQEHGGRARQVVEDARRAALSLGGEELLEALDQTGAADRAVIINALSRVAPLVLEGSLRHQGAEGPQALGLEELRGMIRDPRYHDPCRRDPSFVARVDAGFKRLFPGNYQG
jgi:hypothetical protein